ncbi:MAG: hypothetical protein E6K29_18225 [Gammaproteobacteria bacterium]|nr:MAG: hypothetical protein E6K29_18225 [Gammaproteobacteria bacterium]
MSGTSMRSPPAVRAATATPPAIASRESCGRASNSCCSVLASCRASKRICRTIAVLMRSSHAW